jgi:hypothetical protein
VMVLLHFLPSPKRDREERSDSASEGWFWWLVGEIANQSMRATVPEVCRNGM